MDKIKTVKIKMPDGSVGEETYTISVDAKDVDMKNGKDLQDTIGNIDINTDGNISEQLSDLKNKKIDISDIKNNLTSSDTDKPLAAAQGKELKNQIDIIDTTLKNTPYFFNTIADMQAATYLSNGDLVEILNANSIDNDLYEIKSFNYQLLDINTTRVKPGYYGSNGLNFTAQNGNTAFVGFKLPLGKITITPNHLIAKFLGFTSDDNDFNQAQYSFATRIEANDSLTIDNNGTYKYFGFYCSTSVLEGFQIMINAGTIALPYQDFEYAFQILLDNGLAAKRIYDYRNEKSFIAEDISTKQYICEDSNTKTTYWITHIPRYDKNGNINELKLGFAYNENKNFLTPQTAKDFNDMQNASLTINAGVGWTSYNGVEYGGVNMHGLRVLNHELISNNYETAWYKKTHYALGITEDGLLVSFGTPDANGDVYQSYEESQELNCKYVTSAFTPIMINRVSQKNILPYTNQWVNDGNLVYYQRQVIGQNSFTKDIYIITSNGKGTRLAPGSETQIIDKGLTLDYCIDVLRSLGCDFAYQLDEGGSTSTICRGVQINTPTDSSGRNYRQLGDFLYVDKKILTDRDRDIAALNKEIGNLKYELNRIHNKLYLNVDSDYSFEIQRWQNNSLNTTLNMRSDAIDYYSNTEHKVLFGVDSNGILQTQNGKNGTFSATAKGAYTESDINKPYSNIFIYPYSVENSPYTNYNGLVMSFVLWDDNSNEKMIQIAFPHMYNPPSQGLKPKYRTKTYNQQGEAIWSNWFDIG